MSFNLSLIGLLYLIGINLITFYSYGLDKDRAKKHAWRIPEHTLIGLAFAGGCLGAAAGMGVFHHKTRKTKFRVAIPLALLIWACLIGFPVFRILTWRCG